MNSLLSPLVVTGIGVINAIGQGKTAFSNALFAGKTAFDYLNRPGRVGPLPVIGAEIAAVDKRVLQSEHQRLLRTASYSTQLALIAALEAWHDAKLDVAQLDPQQIGLVVGGSNFQQREQWTAWQQYIANPQFISPTYGLTVWDTDMVGVLSQALQIQGEGYTVGAASASGAMAIIHAARQIQSGTTNISLAVGPLFDLSSWECQGFRNMGAMGSERFADNPQAACRPFDQASDGFIYGEGCGVIVLETAEHASRRGATVYGRLLGWGSALDGNRQSNPSQAGEERTMLAALQMAGLTPSQIDYVNTHGTGSPLGDKTEVAAIQSVGLAHCFLNATKSLTGHCLTAAGVVEAIATLIQMNAGCLHPTNNLLDPIEPALHWIKSEPHKARLTYALSNSFGFGGINSSLVFGCNTE